MKNIAVSWGPPAQPGVTAIMGLGEDEIAANDESQKTLTTIAWASAGVCLLGSITGVKRLRDIGLGGALVAFGVRYGAFDKLLASTKK